MGGIFHLGTGLPYYYKLLFSRAPGSLPFPPRFIGRPPAGVERCLPRVQPIVGYNPLLDAFFTQPAGLRRAHVSTQYAVTRLPSTGFLKLIYAQQALLQ